MSNVTDPAALMNFEGVAYRIVRLDPHLYNLERSGETIGEFRCQFGVIQVEKGDPEQILRIAQHALRRGIVPML